MQITTLELNRLNFYRASELHGGLVLGNLVRRVREPGLILNLTRHSAEEVRHAQLWTETILEVGGAPRPQADTYQRRLARIVGAPGTVFRVLALTQVFERRVFRHFMQHARMAGTHPVVRRALEQMLEEEKGHLSWVADWLPLEAQRRGIDLRPVLEEYALADTRVYDELMYEYRFRVAA
ncbi:MAG TPA: ferritin-like domain-containing protein [Longimicrobiales bacterium]